MAGTSTYIDSLRLNRPESERLMLALALSVFAHILIWAGYELNRTVHWFPLLRRPAHVYPMAQTLKYEDPVEFVTVENPSTQAPVKARYISNKNSVAANSDADRLNNQPKLNGKQTDAPKTETVTRPVFKAQSEPPSTQMQQQQPSQDSGDLTMAKPEEAQQQPRPRTLREALAQQHLPALQLFQNGGVERRARVPSFDVKVTGFGDYDERFIEAVTENWWNLLDNQKFALERTGKVVLLFRLNYDGSISDMTFAENTVGDLLGYVCEKAVLDGAPYERWPDDMRLKLGDYCDVQFTFDYY